MLALCRAGEAELLLGARLFTAGEALCCDADVLEFNKRIVSARHQGGWALVCVCVRQTQQEEYSILVSSASGTEGR